MFNAETFCNLKPETTNFCNTKAKKNAKFVRLK